LPAELAKDQEREQALIAFGYKIVRVQNADVYQNIDNVLAQLLGILEGRND
jgi:very-short-patch-repair endonuclease